MNEAPFWRLEFTFHGPLSIRFGIGFLVAILPEADQLCVVAPTDMQRLFENAIVQLLTSRFAAREQHPNHIRPEAMP